MDQQQPFTSSIVRIRLFYGLLVVIAVIFGLRLFYLQVIKHDYYQQLAQASQLKQFEIPAERGSIYAYDGGEIVPVVLNEVRYRITADPQIIGDKSAIAAALSDPLGRPSSDILDQLQREGSRYEILANKQTKEVKETVEKLRLQGIFTNEKVQQRVYIQGNIAGQLLGFVNDAGEGQYGIEEYLQDSLQGTPGRLRALTDQNNVPLLATGDNVQTDPVDGEDIVLTIDVSMQRQLERILKEGLEQAVSESGSAIIIDPKTGAVRAMANYPSYDPSKFTEVEDIALFQNPAVSSPLEPGSITKALTTAAALDFGAVTTNQTYYDPARWTVDGATITNVEEDGGAATRSVYDVLRYSLNTGATWLLMQMGDGELNEQGRIVWHDYMTNHFQLGKRTGIEQGPPAGDSTEAQGIIPGPNEGFGLNIRYANTSFGQGITATPLQMVAAFSSIINGGTYYKPTLVSAQLVAKQEITEKAPTITKSNVVSAEVSNTIRGFLDNVIDDSTQNIARSGYQIGGKTGTAEIANPDGGYFEDVYNGTFVGFLGGGEVPDYAIIVRVDRPKISGYAGSAAARPIFASLSNMLLDNFTVTREK
jgi:cell division protein FtsI/penicillin-binding protein 2